MFQFYFDANRNRYEQLVREWIAYNEQHTPRWVAFRD